AVQGLEVSLRHLLQNLLLQRQIRHQPPQASVFLLQLLHPACLFQLQTAVFLAPAIVGLFSDARFPADLPGGLVVGYFDFDLPQDRDDLLRTVFLPRHAPAPLVPVSLTFPLVQNSPVRSFCSGNIQSILLSVVEEKERGRGLVGKCFAQLLDDPTAGWMRGDVEVQDATPVVANDEKAVEQVESNGGDSKEVHGGNGFAVIVKKRKPTLRRFRISGCTSHPAGDRTLRYIEAEHEEFAMDARRTPGGI